MGPSISVIGLGKLGAPMAACFAAKGFRVIGVDADSAKVQSMQRHQSPVFEPRLDQLLASSNGRLNAISEIEQAVAATDITFIVVATPSEPGGGFSLAYVLPVCEQIGRALRSKDTFHLVVLTSTVMPGSTGGAVLRALEQASGKRVGQDFGLCYNPEFIALGTVIRDFLNPDFLLIGESDPRSGDILEGIYRQVCENEPPAARLNFVNAEIAKLAVNTYVTTKISFANMLARICERQPGASVDAVSGALGLDSRIGSKYLKGAISYGGPCFPRDNLAMIHLAQLLGAPPDIAQATDSFNRSQVRWLADMVASTLCGHGKAGILGLTYKPYTDVVEEAAGFLLARELASRNVPVIVFDPAGQQNCSRLLDGRVEYAISAAHCVENAQTIVVATPWPEFAEIEARYWLPPFDKRTVIDCWRMLPTLRNVAGINYVPLGMSDSTETVRAVRRTSVSQLAQAGITA